jgi:rubredoxin
MHVQAGKTFYSICGQASALMAKYKEDVKCKDCKTGNKYFEALPNRPETNNSHNPYSL